MKILNFLSKVYLHQKVSLCPQRLFWLDVLLGVQKENFAICGVLTTASPLMQRGDEENRCTETTRWTYRRNIICGYFQSSKEKVVAVTLNRK